MDQSTSTEKEEIIADEPQPSTSSSEQKYVCYRCGMSFPQKYLLFAHVRTHPREEGFTCPHCGKAFPKKNSLYIHNQRQIKGGPHQCTECKEFFVARCFLKQHKLTHVVKKPHTCFECGKSFPRRGNYNRHMQIHSGMKPFKCDHCEMSFVRKDRLQEHAQRRHRFQCDLCKRQFSTPERCKRHEKILHNSLRKLNIDLTKPEMVQRLDSKLQDFARGTGERRKCDKCGLLFLFTSGLKRHYSSHLSPKPLSFGRGQKLLRCLRIWRYHSHKHKGLLRKLLLRWRTFNWVSAPVSHRTKAFYKCVLCSRNFHRPSGFINHMYAHKDEEPLVYRVSSRLFRENPIQN